MLDCQMAFDVMVIVVDRITTFVIKVKVSVELVRVTFNLLFDLVNGG